MSYGQCTEPRGGGSLSRLPGAEGSVRISQKPDKSSVNSRTAVSPMPGQFGGVSPRVPCLVHICAVLSAGQEGRGLLLSHAVALEHCGGRCERSCREWRRPLMFGSAIRSCHLATGTWAVIRVVCADSVPQRFRTDGSAAGQ